MKRKLFHAPCFFYPIVFGLSFVVTLCSNSNAQSFSFPQNTSFVNGFMPTTVTSADAQTAYQVWKTAQVQTCPNGTKRVKYDDSTQTVSEGIGYGMLLSAYYGDKTLFDGLWQYYRNHLNANGIMDWKIKGCTGTRLGNNGATDAELDVAFALLVADKQWSGYLNDAVGLINKIKQYETVVTSTGLHVLKPGDAFGGATCTNASYFSPGYYRVFGKTVPQDSTFWNNMVRDSYVQLNANANTTTGLVSDWQNAVTGLAGDAGCGVSFFASGKNYSYDACRTPWRFGLDYIWGNIGAKSYLNKASNFVSSIPNGGIAAVKDGFKQDGTITGLYHNAPFVGAFAVAAVGTSQQRANTFATDFKNISTLYEGYFGKSLRALYMLTLTGNFWNPLARSSDCANVMCIPLSAKVINP